MVSVKEFDLQLSSTDFLFVRYCRQQNKFTEVLIIYTAEIDGHTFQVVRIDQAHGSLHKDKLYESKAQHIKEEIFYPATSELLFSLIAEIKEKWREYRRLYIKNKLGDVYG